jgi:hypothetical protein
MTEHFLKNIHSFFFFAYYQTKRAQQKSAFTAERSAGKIGFAPELVLE